jgi:hypothetical protein
MPGQVPKPTQIIHMTHVDNLDSILARDCLSSNARLARARRSFTNIAYSSIQQKRAAKVIPCGPGGSLHDYVPFYFCNRSPMLYTINKGNVQCDGGQASIVHLISTVEQVANRGLDFVFTDGHGIMSFTSFYDDLDDLGVVDWNVISARYWNDTAEDGDRSRRRQAEFLVHNVFPWDLVTDIVVFNDSTKGDVEQLVDKHGHQPNILVRRNWYY